MGFRVGKAQSGILAFEGTAEQECLSGLAPCSPGAGQRPSQERCPPYTQRKGTTFSPKIGTEKKFFYKGLAKFPQFITLEHTLCPPVKLSIKKWSFLVLSIFISEGSCVTQNLNGLFILILPC